jgi:hypothetical protein
MQQQPLNILGVFLLRKNRAFRSNSSEFVALCAYNRQKSPEGRFFTLQTPEGAPTSWFFRYKVPEKPTSTTGS